MCVQIINVDIKSYHRTYVMIQLGIMFFIKHRYMKLDNGCDSFNDKQYRLYYTMLESLLSSTHHKGIITEYQR